MKSHVITGYIGDDPELTTLQSAEGHILTGWDEEVCTRQQKIINNKI